MTNTTKPALSAAPVETWKCAARKQSLPEPADCGWPTCGCDPHADKVIAALEEQGHAAPVAQEPVVTKKVYIKPLRTIVEIQTAYADQIRDWLNTFPPTTPAGVGADEIAQIIATKCFDPRVIDSSGKPFWKKSQWSEAQKAANAILALLSRGSGSDQK